MPNYAAAKGWVLMMLNSLRLSSDLLPTDSFLKHYLKSHDAYKLFLTQLRFLSFARETVNYFFLTPYQRTDTQVQLRRYRDIDEDEFTEEEVDIDLGSACKCIAAKFSEIHCVCFIL